MIGAFCYGRAMSETAPAVPQQPPRFMDRVHEQIRVKHYRIRTEHAYVDWVRRYILVHGRRHSFGSGAIQVEGFLTHLAAEGHVGGPTQNRAESGLLFL